MDSRFHLKVEFKIYGRTFTWNPSLNWTADPGEIDRRIADFFIRSHDEARAEFDERVAVEGSEREKAATERREREQLKRLREKYQDA